jgi:hypothetical protein
LVEKESVQARDEELLRDTVEAVVEWLHTMMVRFMNWGLLKKPSMMLEGELVIAKKWELFVYMEEGDGVLSW